MQKNNNFDVTNHSGTPCIIGVKSNPIDFPKISE